MERTFVIDKASMSFSLKAKHLIFITLIVSVFAEFLIDELHVPYFINYINDIMWMGLLIWMLLDVRRNHTLKNQKGVFIVTLLLLISVILGTIINFQSIFLTIWGCRTIFRGIIFFFACIRYLKKKDFIKMMDMTVYLQIFSFILAIYQYVVLGLKQDGMGGLFGHGNGGLLNPFQAIIFTYYLNQFMAKKKDLWKLIVVLLTSTIIAVIAEEKAFFVYLFVSIALTFLLNKPSIKSIVIAIVGVCVAFIMILILGEISGLDINMFLDFDTALDYAENSYGISRINPYETINTEFFGKDWTKYLFGYGIGNCSTSSIDLFNSPFFVRFSNYNYTWFTHAFVVLELGYVGFGLFILFFMAIGINAWKNRKMLGWFANFSIIVVFIALLSMMFTGSLIINGSYIIYFALAGGYLCLKVDKNERSLYVK